MRRSIDAARERLATLDDRDGILDCFFEHAQRLFEFAALFVLKGDSAHGRNVHGLGAPDGLVARLVFPTNEPGVLARVRELRRAFVTASTGGEVDSRLFGSLGRMMPAGLAVPLVVRSRVVAVVLCDGAAAILNDAARAAGRQPMELAKEEMLLWAESVSEALEKLILRLKGGTGSVPPPRGATNRPPPALPPPGALPKGLSVGGRSPFTPADTPDDADVVAPEIAQLISWRPPAPDGAPQSNGATTEATRPRSLAITLAVATVALGGVVLAAFMLGRPAPAPSSRVVVAGAKLAGWPSAVDPAALIGLAHDATGLGARAQLLSLEAVVSRDGRVDFGAATTTGAALLTYRFATDVDELIVRVDKAGLHAPTAQPRASCAGKPCGAVVPPPTCTAAQLWDVLTAAGIGVGERATLRYADSQALSDRASPEWTAAVEGRGELHVDAETCKLFPRSKLRPAARPVSGVPGAPHEVDATALVPLARTQAGLDADAVLLEIDARGVDGRGRVNLAEAGKEIAYTFADPPGTAGRRRWRQVTLGTGDLRITGDENDHAPNTADQGAAPPPPRCTIARAREYMTLGTTAGDADAHITYGADTVSQQSGQWWIEVPTSGLRRRVTDNECSAFARLRKD